MPELTEAIEPSAVSNEVTSLTVSVVIGAYTLDRWEILREGITAIAAQTATPLEIFLVIDHNPELLERARKDLAGIQILPNAGVKGISASRNTAIAVAKGEVLAFLDDDAVAAENWLEELTRPYRDPSVIGTGGMPVARWETGAAPRWLPREFYWTVGCGYKGLPDKVAPIRNPIGATMSFRRMVLKRLGGFSTGFGPNMSTPSPHGGGEEAEFGIRAMHEFPEGKIVHVPDAQVEHWVPAARTTWHYFRRRCWLEGRTKALVTDDLGTADGLASERTYALKTLPSGILIGMVDAVRGDLGGLRRASAIIAGLAFTAAGYTWERLARLRARD